MICVDQDTAIEYVLVTAVYLNAMLLKPEDQKIVADLTSMRLREKGLVADEAMRGLTDLAARMATQLKRSGCGPRCQCK